MPKITIVPFGHTSHQLHLRSKHHSFLFLRGFWRFHELVWGWFLTHLITDSRTLFIVSLIFSLLLDPFPAIWIHRGCVYFFLFFLLKSFSWFLRDNWLLHNATDGRDKLWRQQSLTNRFFSVRLCVQSLLRHLTHFLPHRKMRPPG